jgi:hypothetical protein
MSQNQGKLQNPGVILAVLQMLLKRTDRVHVVLDGLVECEDHQLLIRKLRDVFQARSLGIVKWFWSSRGEYGFGQLASTVNAIPFHVFSETVELDIRRFLEDSPEMAGDTDKSIDDWVHATEGNFLWLPMMLRTLSGCDLTCPAEIEEEMGKFPVGLTGCYYHVLDQCLKKPTGHYHLAR